MGRRLCCVIQAKANYLEEKGLRASKAIMHDIDDDLMNCDDVQ